MIVLPKRSRPQDEGAPGTGAPDDMSIRWPQPVLAAVLVIALFLVSQIVAAVLIGVFGQLFHGQLGGETETQFIFVLLAETLLLGGLAVYLRGTGIGRKQLGLAGRPGWKHIAAALLAFLAYWFMSAVATVAAQSGGVDVDQKQDLGFDDTNGPLTLGLVFVALVVLAPVAEEVLMRGFLFRIIRRRAKFWLAAVVVSLIFATLHLGGGESGAGLLWIAGIDTFLLSLALCYLREKTGSLWPCIFLHALKNFVAFAALFLFKAST